MHPALIVLTSVMVTVFVLVIILNLSAAEKKIQHRVTTLYAVEDPQFERTMSQLLGPPLVEGNHVTGLLNGDQIFPAMLESIRSAQTSITFETYIYWSGRIGREFADALSERAVAGSRFTYCSTGSARESWRKLLCAACEKRAFKSRSFDPHAGTV